jgi:glyoxylase-like metal-dependent hydrolase (beta-lactamase superfamily II)
MLIQTPTGNILWDLIPFLDQETVENINSLGGLKAIVISHPHYYSTYADWALTFSCPVYVGAPDKEWLEQTDTLGLDLRFLDQVYTPINLGPESKPSNATAVLAGGHFPGSLLLLWKGTLFTADTIFTSPSATNPVPGKPGVTSFTFFWSIPNRIPLHPDEVLQIWRKVRSLEFVRAYGAFEGMDVRTMSNEDSRGTGGVKGRLLESCKIFVGAMGWKEGRHEIFRESL